MFISYMESMDAALDSIMRSKADFKGQKAVFGRVFDVLNEPDETRIQECHQNIDLYFDNVSFKYENSDSYVLRNASCKFEEGKKYLIKGKSGEGKSTMIKLLLGFNQPEVGEIMVGQHLVSNIAPRSLLKNIGVVMQENMFFNLSIRENLQIANNDATDEDIINALKSACLYEFVQSLPSKLDTVIGERGVKLSGGQKQRLAIARMILYRPKIIILDEATSAIDSVIESEIINNLNNIFADTTMIVISHKPIPDFQKDQMYILQNQQINQI